MNNKKLLAAAVVLGVALCILVLVKAIGNRAPSESALQFFPGLTEKSIGAVVLKDATDWVKIQRKGDVWVMVPKQVLASAGEKKEASGLSKVIDDDTAVAPAPEGIAASEYPADSGTVASLIENILKLKKDILVSENPAKQTTFEVDTAKGIQLEVIDLNGKSLGKVIIGKNGSDWSSNYVRAENAISVYQVSGISRYVFGTDHKRWTDKSIMKFDKKTVKKIAIAKKGETPVVLALEGDSASMGWNLLQPVKKPADSAKVDELLNGCSNLMASELEDSAYTDEQTGLADPAITVSVTFEGGTVRNLAIGNQKGEQKKFWAKVPEKPYVYLIDDFNKKKFEKKPEEFEKQPLKPIEAVPAKPPKKK
ncbi:MAG: DUF4340 domain-containing protein [Chitinispirillaceae bacterium]|nr:DUF4340 domain-containing protein [Chitinispirillaceae bacterium]